MKKRKFHIAEYEKLNDKCSGKTWSRALVYGLTLCLSILFIFLANRAVSDRLPTFSRTRPTLYKAQVIELSSQEQKPSEHVFEDGTKKSVEHYITHFRATLKEGPQQGETVAVIQNILSMRIGVRPSHLVHLGGHVFIAPSPPGAAAPWTTYGFERSGSLWLLLGVFSLLLLLFARIKGINTLLSLLLTCAAVFFVLVPALLSGHNAYLWTTLVCIFIITMSLLLINGLNKKTLAAGLASIMGMGVASMIMILMNTHLKLTGLVSEEAIYLSRINQGVDIDIKAIMFCAILLGSTGAVMDVAMDIASSLKELSQTRGGSQLKVLLRSGLEIGRDSIGTMANTLILAYVGGSLISLLLLIALNLNNMRFLLNSEGMVVEILQMLIGAFSMLFTIPFATLICALMYSGKASQAGAGSDQAITL